MMRECRSPGVQHQGGANLRAEVLRVGGDGAQGVGGDIKQQAVDHRLVVPRDGADGRGQREHDVVVLHGQQIVTARFEPATCRAGLALGAMPVAAGNGEQPITCRHRACPKCQSLARAQWLEHRQAELLPEVEYFHVVFTVPDPIAALAYQNKNLYDILFRTSAETLRTIAADPKHLGAEIGGQTSSGPAHRFVAAIANQKNPLLREIRTLRSVGTGGG